PSVLGLRLLAAASHLRIAASLQVTPLAALLQIFIVSLSNLVARTGKLSGDVRTPSYRLLPADHAPLAFALPFVACWLVPSPLFSRRGNTRRVVLVDSSDVWHHAPSGQAERLPVLAGRGLWPSRGRWLRLVDSARTEAAGSWRRH